MASIDSALTNDTCLQIQDWARSRTQRKPLENQEWTADMVSVSSVKLMEKLASPEMDRLLEWIGGDKVTKERAMQWIETLMSKENILEFSFRDIIDTAFMLHYDTFYNKRRILVVLKETAYFRSFQMMADKIRIDPNDFVVRELYKFLKFPIPFRII
jgi:hypothetical protein